MVKQYTQEQYEDLFDSLPEELQEAVFSMKTAQAIATACENQDITDERVSGVAKYAGEVLMGVLMPEEFEKVIKQEAEIPAAKAKAIAQEINRFVFFPMRPSLRQLHEKKVVERPEEEAPEETSKLPKRAVPKEHATEEKPPGEDPYREAVEE